jgi:hypothetical protein
MVALALAGCTSAADEGGEEPVGTQMTDGPTFSGEGDEDTEVFTTGPNWELAWETESSEMSIELLTGDAESRGTIIETDEAGGGTSYISEGGEFFLRVTATGSWQVEIAVPTE